MGRSFADAKHVATSIKARLFIVSAGLGLVAGGDLVPPYDLTISPGSGSILPRLRTLEAYPADWWDALGAVGGAPASLSELVRLAPEHLVLMALPSSYVSMIHRDLARLPKTAARRLRVITSVRGRALVPSHLDESVLPYDERLEGSAYAGTRSDFAQRALRHFVENLRGHELPLKEARAAVEEAMSALHQPLLPKRKKQRDDQIEALLQKHWDQHGGSSTRLLRFLRDDKQIACEQSRFRGLWMSVAAQRAAGA